MKKNALFVVFIFRLLGMSLKACKKKPSTDSDHVMSAKEIAFYHNKMCGLYLNSQYNDGSNKNLYEIKSAIITLMDQKYPDLIDEKFPGWGSNY